MGNKLVISPFPNYDHALTLFTKIEINQVRGNFICLTENVESISLDKFIKTNKIQSNYIRKHVLIKLFHIIDTKRDGIIDFEEYLCVVALFRFSSLDERIKCIYLMYCEINKTNYLSKDNLRSLVVDLKICENFILNINNNISNNNNNNNIEMNQNNNMIEKWLDDMKLLSLAITESILLQYSNQINKIDLNDFIYYAKDNGLDGFYKIIIYLIDN